MPDLGSFLFYAVIILTGFGVIGVIADRKAAKKDSALSTCVRCVAMTTEHWGVVGPDRRTVSDHECRPCAEDDATRRGIGFKVRRLA